MDSRFKASATCLSKPRRRLNSAGDKAILIGTVLHEENAPAEDSGLDPPAKKRAQNSEDDIL